MHQGSCLCGAIQYEIENDLKAIVHCHCQFCRKAHGAAFVTLLLMQVSDLRIVQGEEVLGRFHVEATGVDRCFCLKCGTRLYNHVLSAGRLALVVATLQTDATLRPVAHCNTESKCPWYEINDGLPQFLKAPGPAELRELLSI